MRGRIEMMMAAARPSRYALVVTVPGQYVELPFALSGEATVEAKAFIPQVAGLWPLWASDEASSFALNAFSMWMFSSHASFRYGDKVHDIPATAPIYDRWIEIAMARNVAVIDGQTIHSFAPDSFPAAASNARVFASPSGYSAAAGTKVESFKAVDGANLVHLVAVPKGSLLHGAATPAPSNCLYDKVSGTYFENAGAGGEFGIEEVTA